MDLTPEQEAAEQYAIEQDLWRILTRMVRWNIQRRARAMLEAREKPSGSIVAMPSQEEPR